MRRPRVLIAAGIVAFLAVSVVLASYLTSAGAERDPIFALLRAQARGDVPGMLERLPGCAAAPGCRAQALANARRLRRPGQVKILALESPTAYHVGTTTGLTRVAWAVVDRNGPAVVQCVTVSRHWGVFSGTSVTLRRLSAPIPPESSC
jgi:hypothetical protein